MVVLDAVPDCPDACPYSHAPLEGLISGDDSFAADLADVVCLPCILIPWVLWRCWSVHSLGFHLGRMVQLTDVQVVLHVQSFQNYQPAADDP